MKDNVMVLVCKKRNLLCPDFEKRSSLDEMTYPKLVEGRRARTYLLSRQRMAISDPPSDQLL